MAGTRASLRFVLGLALLPLACRHEEQTPSGVSVRADDARQEPSAMSSPFDPKRPPDRMAPPEAPFAVGEWATADDYRLRLTEVRECEVESYFAPRGGHIKLGAKLELEAGSAAEVPSNQLHAVLVDAEGSRYPATLAGCRPSLPTVRLSRGKSASGFVTFDVPRDASGLTLRYEPVIVGRAESAVSITLGR